MFTTEQDDGESLLDYTKRFKQSKDNFKNVIGEELLEKFVENTKSYNACTNDVDRKIIKN